MRNSQQYFVEHGVVDRQVISVRISAMFLKVWQKLLVELPLRNPRPNNLHTAFSSFASSFCCWSMLTKQVDAINLILRLLSFQIHLCNTHW